MTVETLKTYTCDCCGHREVSRGTNNFWPTALVASEWRDEGDRIWQSGSQCLDFCTYLCAAEYFQRPAETTDDGRCVIIRRAPEAR